MDNVYPWCPSRMSDGRFATSYLPRCYEDNKIQIENGIYNSYQYRQFLQANAKKIIELNRLESIDRNLCRKCDLNEYNPHWTKMKPLHNYPQDVRQ